MKLNRLNSQGIRLKKKPTESTASSEASIDYAEMLRMADLAAKLNPELASQVDPNRYGFSNEMANLEGERNARLNEYGMDPMESGAADTWRTGFSPAEDVVDVLGGMMTFPESPMASALQMGLGLVGAVPIVGDVIKKSIKGATAKGIPVNTLRQQLPKASKTEQLVIEEALRNADGKYVSADVLNQAANKNSLQVIEKRVDDEMSPPSVVNGQSYLLRGSDDVYGKGSNEHYDDVLFDDDYDDFDFKGGEIEHENTEGWHAHFRAGTTREDPDAFVVYEVQSDAIQKGGSKTAGLSDSEKVGNILFTGAVDKDLALSVLKGQKDLPLQWNSMMKGESGERLLNRFNDLSKEFKNHGPAAKGRPMDLSADKILPTILKPDQTESFLRLYWSTQHDRIYGGGIDGVFSQKNFSVEKAKQAWDKEVSQIFKKYKPDFENMDIDPNNVRAAPEYWDYHWDVLDDLDELAEGMRERAGIARDLVRLSKETPLPARQKLIDLIENPAPFNPIAGKKIWEPQVINQIIKTARSEGLTKVRLPFGETVSKIQGWGSIVRPGEGVEQSILSRYNNMPKTLKKMGITDVRAVTDKGGDSWYEFDLPSAETPLKAFSQGGVVLKNKRPNVRLKRRVW